MYALPTGPPLFFKIGQTISGLPAGFDLLFGYGFLFSWKWELCTVRYIGASTGYTRCSTLPQSPAKPKSIGNTTRIIFGTMVPLTFFVQYMQDSCKIVQHKKYDNKSIAYKSIEFR